MPNFIICYECCEKEMENRAYKETLAAYRKNPELHKKEDFVYDTEKCFNSYMNQWIKKWFEGICRCVKTYTYGATKENHTEKCIFPLEQLMMIDNICLFEMCVLFDLHANIIRQRLKNIGCMPKGSYCGVEYWDKNVIEKIKCVQTAS